MVGRSSSEATKHSAASLTPKNDKLTKPKKSSTDLFKGGNSFTKNPDEIRIMSKSTRPKTMGLGSDLMGVDSSFTKNSDETRIMSKSLRPETMGLGADSLFTKNSEETRMMSKSSRPKTMGLGNDFMEAGSSLMKNLDEIRIMNKSSRPKTMGLGSDFAHHGAKSPLAAHQDSLCRPGGFYLKQRPVGTGSRGFEFYLGTDGGRSNPNPFVTHATEHDVLRGQMARVPEQYVDQGAAKAGGTQNKPLKKNKDIIRMNDLVEENLNPGARSKKLREKPKVLLPTAQYADQGKGKAPKKGKKKAGHVSFSSPQELETYEALQESVKALKEETRLLSQQMQDEAIITARIQEENVMLLDQLRLRCPPSVIAQLEAEDPSRRGA